ncbi:MAG TPA: hypothetical protein VGQ69_03070 [Gemmatimonadales bacterium]|jgi:hypothetical protein|nr:hypothetical protein [Gemmatimonadales bacterium]
MSLAHDHLERMLAGVGPGDEPYHWHHLLGVLHAVCGERSPESETLLRRVASSSGHCRLDQSEGLPHAMSPEDVLRSLAVQTLAEWDLERHRDVIARAAELAGADHVSAIARSYLA